MQGPSRLGGLDDRAGVPKLALTAGLGAMRSLDMHGFHPLSDAAIDAVLTRTAPGNYALGYLDGTTFVVFYVGRADTDLRGRLHSWVGKPGRYERYAPASKAAWGTRVGATMPLNAPALGRVGVSDSSYTHFAYSYAPSAEAAFEKQCRNYSDFGGSHGLDNSGPPGRTRRSFAEHATQRSAA